MSKEYTLADFTDIFDYSTGWFSDSSICSLFYQIFKRFPSMKMVKYKVNQDFLKEIKELYQQDDAFDIFEHIYCNHFENEKEEEEEEEDTSTKELYDCIVICKKNLMSLQPTPVLEWSVFRILENGKIDNFCYIGA